jgi:hypothetical protein
MNVFGLIFGATGGVSIAERSFRTNGATTIPTTTKTLFQNYHVQNAEKIVKVLTIFVRGMTMI